MGWKESEIQSFNQDIQIEVYTGKHTKFVFRKIKFVQSCTLLISDETEKQHEKEQSMNIS